jgi:type IV pilus assembly protein PilA
MTIAFKKQSIAKRQQRGQGMTEYIIIVALIAIAGIVVFAAFGDVVKNQTAAMAQELSGTSGSTANGQAGTRAGNAETAAGTNGTLKNFVGQQGK